MFNPPHVLRVVLPWIDLDGLLNTAVEQIQAYAYGDAAVSLRLLRLLTVENDSLRDLMVERGERIVAGCRSRLPPDDLIRLERRFTVFSRARRAADRSVQVDGFSAANRTSHDI